jgi:SMODS domain-containing protein
MATQLINPADYRRSVEYDANGLRKTANDGLTVTQAFDELLSDIEITDAEREEASRQQQSVRKKLAARLELIATFLSGSYRRNTQTWPCDDIDLLAVLDHEFYGADDADDRIELTADGAKVAVDLVFEALRDAYPHTELRRFDRGVQIKFSGSGIGFDVVPAFQFAEHEFWIPDRKRGLWIRTNPKEQQRLVSESNQEQCEQMLVPLVKLLKTWNDERGKSKILRGFQLEAMAYHALRSAPSNYPEGVELLLRDAATRVLSPVPDIWPSGEPVTTDLSWSDRLSASAQLLAAADDAQRAIDANDDSREDDAHEIWFELFGTRYPGNGYEKSAKALSAPAALERIRKGAPISATSAGLIAPQIGYRSAPSITDHGGVSDPAVDKRTIAASSEPLTVATIDRLERQIAQALRQFQALRRMTPAEAAADPSCWPVTTNNASELYVVLVGEQRTNTGRKHDIFVTVPRDLPATEPRVYLLHEHRKHRPARGGWRAVRAQRHRWRDGALCTHAMRDRWDGRLVTALVYAADYLVRHDYYQLTGSWIGREIRPDGTFRPADSSRRRRVGR